MENEPQQSGPIIQSSDDKTSTHLPPIQPPPKNPKTKTKLAAIGGILVTLLIIGAVRLATTVIFTDKGNGSIQEQAKTLLSSEERKEYVSAEHKFRVNFPGFPAIERQSVELEGYPIPYVTYSGDVNNGEEAYVVMVIDYAQIPLTAEELSLEGALNGMVQNIPGAKLVSSKVITFRGLNGTEGVLDIPLEGKQYDGYVRIVQLEKKFYGIMTIGASFDNFSSFGDSLVLQ